MKKHFVFFAGKEAPHTPIADVKASIAALPDTNIIDETNDRLFTAEMTETQAQGLKKSCVGWTIGPGDIRYTAPLSPPCPQ